MPRKPETDRAGKRKADEKKLVVEHLERTPIVQLVCEKIGISRATYYRWTKEDKAFAAAAKEALRKGVSVMNDLAESQLLKSVKDGNLTAIIFWLKSRHQAYGNRVEIVENQNENELSPEQKKILRRVLKAYR